MFGFFSEKALFVLKYDANWIGGVYYKIHLIRALRGVNSSISIVVYTESENIPKVKDLLSKFDVVIKSYDPAVPRGLWRLEIFSRRILGRSLIGLTDSYLGFGNILFDYSDNGILRACPVARRIYWIPDLQDLYMPELFSNSALEARKRRYEFIELRAHQILFSSDDSWQSFRRFYPEVTHRKVKIHILKFAVFHPVVNPEISDKRLNVLGLENEKFFIVSNQFMAHKNHELIIDALALLKTGNVPLGFKMVFTGQTYDPRNPEFFPLLQQKIISSGLENDIIITGVMERVEQLALLRKSISVIQPSFFEGWNSTVEDAKLLKTNIICSDIAVHKEQLNGYPAVFFNPSNAEQLAALLSDIIERGWTYGHSTMDYGVFQNAFAKQIERIFLE